MKTTEENNRLIAEFMGFEQTSIGWFDSNEMLNLPYTSDNTFDNLLFHTSWEWLMPVVNKIRTLYNNCEVDGDEAFDIIDVLSEGCIEANIFQAFDAVVQFIEWYNKQTK